MNKRLPIGFWNHLEIEHTYHDDPRRVVRDWGEAGMTLAQSPSFSVTNDLHRQRIKALLEAADDADIQVLLRCRESHWRTLTRDGESAYRAVVSALLDDFGGHPAMWGVMIGDEPDAAAFDDACRACRIAKELAPDKTPYINLLPWFVGVEGRVGVNDWAAYLDAFVAAASPDVLSYDCYVQMNPDPEDNPAGYEVYFTNLREFQAAGARHGIPWWTTLLATPHFHYQPPREDHFRWQLNTALAHGARGVLWYFLYMVTGHPHVNYRQAPIDEFQQRTESYAWLGRVCRSSRAWHLPLLQDMTLERVHHVGRAWGGVPLFPADGTGVVTAASAHGGTPLIISEFRHLNGTRYLMLVNNSQARNDLARLRVRPELRLYQVQWEGETALTADIEAWLAPGQAELYRIAAHDE